MSSYRLYCMDGSGKIQSAEWIEADGDDEALTVARSTSKTFSCEIWQGERLVARLPALQRRA